MNEISPRPWRIADTIDAVDTYRRYILDANGNRICSMYRKDFNDYCTCMPDAEHIVKCVNEHDSLVARAEKAEADVNRLRDVLRSFREDGYDHHFGKFA